MQRKEVEEQLDMLKSAILEKQPSSSVITILRRLQLEVVPTEEILRVGSLCLSPVLSTSSSTLAQEAHERLQAHMPLEWLNLITLNPWNELTNLADYEGWNRRGQATNQSR